MDTEAHDRLINLLARTTSEHDGEALTAARKANQLLVRHGLTWADVIPSRTPDLPAWRTAGGSPEAPHSTDHRDPGVGSGIHHRPPPHSAAHRHRASPRGIAGACLGYGLGLGILFGTVVALVIAAGDDASELSDYKLAGLAFAIPALMGFVLSFPLGRRRKPPYRPAK
jgi:hypothetical protein